MRNNLRRQRDQISEDDEFVRPIGTTELNFSNDQPNSSFVDLDIESEKFNKGFYFKNADYETTEVESLEQDVTQDDLSPEILIKEDGALSSYEEGNSEPADQSFTIVGEREIGGGNGLDEAELALKDPLDGKPWDGKTGDA